MPPVAALGAAFVITYVAGYFTGRIVTHRKLGPQEVTMQIRDRLRRFTAGPYAMFVAFVALLAVGVQLTISQQQGNHAIKAAQEATRAVQVQSACFQKFADQLYASLQPTRVQSKKYRDADTAFTDKLLDLFNPKDHQAAVDAFKAATIHKKKVADRLNHEALTHPIPEPPRKVCAK